jgi:osmotically-inducible protein OsmY
MRNFPHGSCAKQLILNESSLFEDGTIVALTKELLRTRVGAVAGVQGKVWLGYGRIIMLEKRSDRDLKQRVLRELKWDSRINWASINVEVNEAVATLTGAVPSYAQKIAAQDAAHRVGGVLDVANDIEVMPLDRFIRTDSEIAGAVRNALEWDALVPNELIQSTVSDGWVTLEGEVDYWRERNDAERAIRQLAGVVGVINKITIRKQEVNAKQLREEIEFALERRADREAERLRIEVNDGAVDLWGRVHSWQEKRAVLGSISHAPGVTQVRDHVRIDPYF